VWGPALAASIRGYAGDINAASSLDLVSQVATQLLTLPTPFLCSSPIRKK
jgi:hypothetical protein